MWSVFIHAVGSIAVILLFGVVGYLFAEKGWMDAQAKQFLNKLLSLVIVPCMCIYGEITNLQKDLFASVGRYLLAIFLCMTVLMLLSIFVGKRMGMNKKTWSVFATVSSVSNAMFLGYPICLELFGTACIPYVMIYYVVNTVFTNIVCTALMRWAGREHLSLGGLVVMFFKTPMVLATVAGLLLVAFDITLPPLMVSFTKYMNDTVTPLVLILIGYTLHEIGLKDVRLRGRQIAVVLFRFMAAPAMMILLCSLFGITGTAQKVLAILAAMPSASLSIMLASEYGADDRLAAQSVAITTLGCLVEIPLLMVLL